MEQTVRQYVDNEMGDIRFEDEIQDELQDFNIDPNKDRTIH